MTFMETIEMLNAAMFLALLTFGSLWLKAHLKRQMSA